MKTRHYCDTPDTDSKNPEPHQFGPVGARWTCPEPYCGKVWYIEKYLEAVPAYREFHAVNLPIWRVAPAKEQSKAARAKHLVPGLVALAIYFLAYSVVYFLAVAALAAVPTIVLVSLGAIVPAALIGVAVEKRLTPNFYGKARNRA